MRLTVNRATGWRLKHVVLADSHKKNLEATRVEECASVMPLASADERVSMVVYVLSYDKLLSARRQ